MKKKIGKYTVDLDKMDFNKGEIFKQYNDRFIVSNYARCYDMKKERYIKDFVPKKSPYMLWYFSDFDDKNTDSQPIHTVVAELFCKKPDVKDRLVVDHIDGDKHNNMASNLRYITYKENSNAQDVQKRKRESQAKTLEYKKNIEALTKIIAAKDDEIEALKELLSQQNEKIETLEKNIQEMEESVQSIDSDKKWAVGWLKDINEEIDDLIYSPSEKKLHSLKGDAEIALAFLEPI